jgi:hypothetical protein
MFGSELSVRGHILNNFRSAKAIELWISPWEKVNSEVSISLILIRFEDVSRTVFIAILFSLSIFINFHDNLTLNYTKLYPQVPCAHSKTITFYNNFVEENDREDEIKI